MDLISRQDAIDAIEDDSSTGVYSCFASYNDAQRFKQTINELPSAQQWIPCSERLPEEDGRYLCTYLDFGICVDFGLYTNGQWFIEPIAWMPLPEPWKGETN